MKNNSGSKLSFAKRTFLIFGGLFILAILLYFLFNYNFVLSSISKIFAILRPVFVGLVIAFLVNPATDFFTGLTQRVLQKITKSKKEFPKTALACGITISLIIFVAIIFLLFYAIIPNFVISIRDFANDFVAKWDEIVAWSTNVFNIGSSLVSNFYNQLPSDITASLGEYLSADAILDFVEKNAMTVATGFINSVVGTASFILDFIIGIVVAVYALANKDVFKAQFKKILCAVFSKRIVNAVVDVARKSNEIFTGFINGKLINAFVIGLICFIVVSIMRLPYPMLITVIIAVTDLIPIFGPYIGTIPCALLILFVDPIKCIPFIIFIIILQVVEGNIISPKILGESIGISAFWVIFAIIIGGGLFGIVGMVIGVPAFAVLYYIAKRFFEHLLSKKELPTNTECYVNGDYPVAADSEENNDE